LTGPEEKPHHVRELSKDVLAYGSVTALSRLSGLILLPILTRVLSVAEYGIIDVIAVVVAVLSSIMRLALPQAISRLFWEISTPFKRSQLVTTVFAFAGCVGLAFAVGSSRAAPYLSSTLLGSTDYATFIRFGCWIALLDALIGVLRIVLRLDRRVLVVNGIDLFTSVSYAVLAVYLVVVRGSGLIGVFLAQALSQVGGLLLFAIFARGYFTARLSSDALKQSLRFSLPMFPGQLMTQANNHAGRVLILFLVGLPGVAIYAAAARLVQLVQFLLYSVMQAWEPYAMRLLQAPERDEIYGRMLKYFAAAFAVFGLVLTSVSPELLALLTPVEYGGAYLLVPWLLGAVVLQRSGMFTRLGVLIGKRTAVLSLAALLALAVNIALGLLLIPLLGEVGATIGMFVSQLCASVFLAWSTTRVSSIRFQREAILGTVASYVIGSGSLLVAAEIASPLISVLARLTILVVTVASICYLACDRRLIADIRSLRVSGQPEGDVG
jgi:O-antigen/teichoic acid export membrane protein